MEDLLRKDAIEMVPLQEINCGFYSTFFLVPKKKGKMRPVINLRPLNKYLRKTHFKMDTLSKVLNLVKPKDGAISLDLSDAYLHVPIFLKHRKFLRFCVNKKCYQFKALCFGPTSAPRVFTKIVAVVAAHLREQNVRLASYLDDWLALNQIRKYLLQDRAKCLNLLTSLGFIVNIEKSSLEPSQTITYIGGLFHLDQGLVFPTPERVQKLLSAVGNLSKTNKATAKDFLHLLGLIASCLELIPNARLYMRPVQLHLLSFWKPSSMRLETEIPVTQHLRSHLKWWLDIANITKGRSLQQRQTAVTITTDASKTGYGDYIGNQFVQGTWSVAQKKTAHKCSGVGGSISYTKTFSINSERPECASSVRLDNRCPIFEQTRLDSVSTDVLPDMGPLELGSRESNAHQSSSHFGAKESIGRSVEQEQGITHRMDTEQDDCFEAVPFVGSANDRSFCISGKSTSSNILFLVSSSSSTSSGCTDNFVGQDVCIRIPSTLPNSKSSATHETLQVSDNTDSTSVAQEALVHRTSSISSRLSTKTASAEKSVTSAKKQNKPSKSRRIQLDCLASLNRNFKEKGFSKKARELLTSSWRKGTQKDYTSKFKKFCSWCRTRKIDSYSASLTEVADFLSDLFAEGLQYRTIAGYRSMLSSVLSPINNIPVGQHPYIIRLLKGVFNSRLPKSKLLPEWDLQKVLNMLQKEPFEPISAASLKLITYKVVFLTAISTFRRCSDLQSLKIGERNVSVQKKGLTFIRHGLSKQDRQTHYGTKVFVPAFPENKKLDPKRAFYFYLKKTESLRTKTDGSSEDRVFLAINEPHQAVTSQTISKWIVKTIRMAYNDSKMKVKGHSTRAIGPSWALYNGASVKSILEAADWKKESTFIQFYFRNVDVEVLKQ